jgi:AAA domain
MATEVDGIWTTVEESPDHSVAKLIRAAEQNRQSWLIDDLWQQNAIVALHSLEGEFKSILAYQTAEALATGQMLLERWAVPEPVRVAVLQTEMPDNMVGDRLKAMYHDGRIPENLIVSNDAVRLSLLQKFSPSDKFLVIHNWLMDEDAEVLVWDTINGALASLIGEQVRGLQRNALRLLLEYRSESLSATQTAKKRRRDSTAN